MVVPEKKVKDICVAVLNWTKGRLLLNAAHYPDRMPNYGHINLKVLERIYDGLKYDVGDIEATNFVNLVYYLEDMTTSVFVGAFKKFWEYGCLMLPHQAKGFVDESQSEGSLDIKKLALAVTSVPLDCDRAIIAEESLVIKKTFLAHHKDEVLPGLLSKE